MQFFIADQGHAQRVDVLDDCSSRTPELVNVDRVEVAL
jgi:hypothetical protein